MPRKALRSPEALAAAARRRRRLEAWLPWLVIAGMFLIWEAAVRIFAIQPFILPAPSAIAASMVKWWQPLLTNSWATLLTTVIGFAMAIVFGLLLGVVIGSSVLVYRGLYPLLIAFNSVPKVAVVPILVIWFGAGFWPAVLTAFLISFFPIVVNVATGIATVEPELRDVLRALGASPGTWTTLGGERFKIQAVALADLRAPAGTEPGTVLDNQLGIACGEGTLRITRAQRPGKAPQEADVLLRGWPVAPGTVLGRTET
jgi:ABC-type phosphate/phosphonate transport system permease subunit